MFSPFQKKIAAAALTCLGLSVIAAFVVLIFHLLSAFLGTFGSVVWPLALAGILTFMFKPLVGLICSKTGMNAHFATLAVFILLIAAVLALAALIAPLFIGQVSALIQAFPELARRTLNFVGEHVPALKDHIAQIRDIDLQNLSKETTDAIFTGSGKFLRAALRATSGAVHFVAYVAAFAAAPIYLYYMLSSRYDLLGTLKKNISFLPEKWRDDIVFLVGQFGSIMSAFFRGQMLIAFIMGSLLGTGFLAAGLHFGFLIGFFAGILNVIPYFGTMVGLGVALPMAFFQNDGGIILLAVVLGIFLAVQMFEGYFLTPKIMGGNTGLHPTVIIFSVFFWGIALNGILGMILAIPLSAFVVVFWKLLRTKYLPGGGLHRGKDA